MEERMLSDEELLALIKKNSGGGGGGTSDYTQLSNLPQINSVELTGNKSLSDLGIASEESLSAVLDDLADEFDSIATYAVDDYVLKDGVLYKCTTAHTGAWDANDFTVTTVSDEITDVADAVDEIKDGTDIDSFGDVETSLADKQDTLTFDNAPTENSNNPVKSGGVYSALAGKQGTLIAGDYISLNDGNIAVNRNIVRDNYAYNIKFSGDNDLTVTKSQGGTVISTTQYTYEYGSGGGVTYTIDDAFTLETIYYGGQYFKYTALRDSTTHSAGYTWQVEAHDTSTDVTEYFPTEDLSGYKLVIKSEMDTALSDKQDALTFDDTPTDNSNNPVKSNGIYDALALKQNATDNSLDTEDKTIVGAINEHEGDIGSLKRGLTNLSEEVNGDATTYQYADVITIDNAVPSNLADCSVKIEPVQDLHGYDKPWVGGADKNIIPMTVAGIKASNTTGTWTGNVYALNGVTFEILTDNDNNVIGGKLNGTNNSGSGFDIVLYRGNLSSIMSIGETYTITDCSVSDYRTHNYSGTFTVDSDWNITDSMFKIWVGNSTTFNNEIRHPQLEVGNQATTFAPYTNLCPISGHTEVDVQRDGRNMYSGGEAGMINQGTGEDEPSGTVTRSYFINVGSSNSIALSYFDSTSSGVRVFYYGKNKVYMTNQVFNFDANNSIIVSRPNGCEWIRFQAGIAVYLPTSSIQVELGSSATDYEPYQGKTYTIALGDTIYGGTVDFDSGVMTVTHAFKVYEGETSEGWSAVGTQSGNTYRMKSTDLPANIKLPSNNDETVSAISNQLIAVSANQTFLANQGLSVPADGSALSLYIESYNTNDVSLWKTYLASNPLQVCYELATPFTVQLTPQQIQLLKGTNTLTASTGQISVTVNGVSGSIGAVQEQVNATDAALAELAEQLPDAPTTDGAYVLTVTVADGTPTYSWESAT